MSIRFGYGQDQFVKSILVDRVIQDTHLYFRIATSMLLDLEIQNMDGVKITKSRPNFAMFGGLDKVMSFLLLLYSLFQLHWPRNYLCSFTSFAVLKEVTSGLAHVESSSWLPYSKFFFLVMTDSLTWSLFVILYTPTSNFDAFSKVVGLHLICYDDDAFQTLAYDSFWTSAVEFTALLFANNLWFSWVAW